ncbi:MAG TPA: ABATE domain-containing protein [Gemmatimonadaceae bacterium]|jgi:predicted RNA-binding Zn ribbon-like protein|nr:ABATE domain-containing protein [Gemmatimonadaceae bacterium]
MVYAGPLRDEPIAIELHNTVYAVGGTSVDGFADEASAQAWLEAIAPRLPDHPGEWPSREELVALRDSVRSALQAAVAGAAPDPAAIEAINRASARAPRSPLAQWGPDGSLVAATDYHGAGRADIVIGALAADAIDLLTGPRRDQLRTCGAPGCVLMFIKHHPRREWCSNGCGNRARQARHYQRARRRAS